MSGRTNNGNLISKMPKNPLKKVFQYSYSSKNQLIEVRILASSFGQLEKKVNFVYDAIGRRIEKKVIDQVAFHSSTTRYVYDGDNIVGQFDEAGNLLQRNLYSPRSADDILASEITASGVASGISGTAGSIYYFKDKLGSISDIVDQNGTVLQKYDYAAFGKILSIKDRNGVDITATPLIKNAFTFTAREYDEEIDMYFYRARYYDANIGRFIQSDPDPGSLSRPATVINKYAYVSNTPTKFTDPTGQKYGKGGDKDPSDIHGNYCGASANGQRQEPFVRNSPEFEDPEDGLDNACRYHDNAYKDFKTVFALNQTPNRIGSDLDLVAQGLFYTFSPQVFNKPLDGIAVALTGAGYLYLEVSIISQITLVNVIGNFFGIRLFDF